MTRAEERGLMRAGIHAKLDALEARPEGGGRVFVGQDEQAAKHLIKLDQQLVHEARDAQDLVQVWHKARLRGFSELYAAVTGKRQQDADEWLHDILKYYGAPIAAPTPESTGRKLRDVAGKRARESAGTRGDWEPTIEWHRVRQGGQPHADLPSITERCVGALGPLQLSGSMIGEALVEYVKYFQKAQS